MLRDTVAVDSTPFTRMAASPASTSATEGIEVVVVDGAVVVVVVVVVAV